MVSTVAEENDRADVTVDDVFVYLCNGNTDVLKRLGRIAKVGIYQFNLLLALFISKGIRGTDLCQLIDQSPEEGTFKYLRTRLGVE